MKKSKLDQHGEFIMTKAIAGISFSQIRRDLVAKGCERSRSRLTEWIETTAAAQGIKLPPRRRGRPVKTKSALFSFLPPEGTQGQEMPSVPPLLMILKEMPVDMKKIIRDKALAELGSPEDKLDRLANLGDIELCLLAMLLGDLSAPPLSEGQDDLTAWFANLVNAACRLRAKFRQALEARNTCI